jgi:hypothetical protein
MERVITLFRLIALRELLEKGSDATLLREMIGFAAQRLMELETEALCGAARGERSEGRTNLRNEEIGGYFYLIGSPATAHCRSRLEQDVERVIRRPQDAVL